MYGKDPPRGDGNDSVIELGFDRRFWAGDLVEDDDFVLVDLCCF